MIERRARKPIQDRGCGCISWQREASDGLAMCVQGAKHETVVVGMGGQGLQLDAMLPVLALVDGSCMDYFQTAKHSTDIVGGAVL